MNDLDIARRVKRDLNELVDRHGATELVPSLVQVQEYVEHRSNPPTEEDLYAAFQAGFTLGRQPGPLPGPLGARLQTAYDKWRR